MRRTKAKSKDSDDPRVEMENTIGLRRWMAVYNVACVFILAINVESVFSCSGSVVRIWFTSTL